MSTLFTAVDGDIIQLPWGEIILHNNELHIRTSVADPPGISLLGFTGSKISWKDEDGNEKVLFQLRQNAKGDGEYYVGCFSQKAYDGLLAEGGRWALKALDLAMIEVATINPDGIEFRVPVKFSAGIIGGAGTALAGVSRFVSDNGRYVFNVQGDQGGHIVVYDTWDAQGNVIPESQWSQTGAVGTIHITP